MLEKKVKLPLFTLRLGVFLVFFVWTLDKFLKPQHAEAVFKKFYMFNELTVNMSYAIGSIQLVIIFAFLFGVKKRISYGLVLLMHAVSTLSTYQQYFDPYSGRNLLFFAAWPMLAACFTLYWLRDHDTMFSANR